MCWVEHAKRCFIQRDFLNTCHKKMTVRIVLENGRRDHDDRIVLQDLKLTNEEELEMFEAYIPQYFEDDAPLSIMLSGSFIYTPGQPEWGIFNVRECSAEDETVYYTAVFGRKGGAA